MEHGLGAIGRDAVKRAYDVLILVLMEHGLGGNC